MDYIGKVKLNYEYYTGTDDYSDGDENENLLLEIVKNNSDYTEIVANTSSWPVLYHLSETRGNIIEWLPITKDDNVLEIGAGCGAITTFLAQKAGKVTCVELSKRRALINAYKNKDFDNIEIFVGKFEDIIIKQKYDYIMLIGVLEYAKEYTDSTTPYLSFLEQIKEFLNPNGKIIVAIENRLGLKYFAGCREDHTRNYFDGIQGYSDESFVRTFSKNELELLFIDAGFEHFKFYYPYPDYKLPLVIYSDDYLPKKGDIRDNTYNFDSPRVHLFNEGRAFDSFVDSKLFPLFSNSFLCIVSKEKIDNSAIYIKYLNERRNEFKTKKEILNINGQKKALKTFLKEEGKQSLQHLLSNYEKSKSICEKSNCFELLEIRQINSSTIESDYIEGQTYDRYLEQIYKEKGLEYLISEIENYKNAVFVLTNRGFRADEKYMEIFGDIRFDENDISIYPANMDLIPRNIILNKSNNKYIVIDPEWIFDITLPAEYILYRSVLDLDFLSLKDKNILLNEFSFKYNKIIKYGAMEEKFQSYVLNNKKTLREIYEKNNYSISEFFEETYIHFDARQDNFETFLSLADKYKSRITFLAEKNADLKRYLSLSEEILYGIDNSLSWKITKPFRIISQKTRLLLNKFNPAKLFLKEPQVLKINAATVKTENLDDNEPHGYISFYQDNLGFSSYSNNREIKTLAFYLPQFHTFPENDEWWGKGFTEWTNTRKAKPRFKNHYQPRTPHYDIGYYDLSDFDVLIKQAELAKEHGIYGFCFYYYWFSGKRLMEMPLDLFLEHKEIDIKFCLCWANGNWNRTWDGLENDVLIEQKYREDDVLNYVRDIKKYILDDRYIRINGKPVFMVYDPLALPDAVKFFKELRFYAKEEGIGDILIWICKEATHDAKENELKEFVDKMVEFPPRSTSSKSIALDGIVSDGGLYDYKKLVNEHAINYDVAEKDVYKTAMLGWDNSARRKDYYTVYDNFDIKSFYDWVSYIASYTAKYFKPEERFMFINAWNEWAEGTYLEPDEKYGYTSINTFSRALFELNFDESIVFYNSNEKARILIQAHIFYEDLTEEIVNYLNNIPEYFDCYITTNTIEKANEISKIARLKLKANKVKINVLPNRGRDVAPFILQIKDEIGEYEYFCHIHTKKSQYFEVGDEWRQYLLNNLLYSEECISRILDIFESNSKIGIIYPETYPKIESRIAWGGNKETTTKLFERIGCAAMFDEKPEFPAGNMFWARVDAVRQIFESDLSFEDFPEEQGQIDSTLAHAIERSWYYIAKSNGYTAKKLTSFG